MADFETALAALQQSLADLDGDGVPDAMQGGSGMRISPPSSQQSSRPTETKPDGTPDLDAVMQNRYGHGAEPATPQGPRTGDWMRPAFGGHNPISEVYDNPRQFAWNALEAVGGAAGMTGAAAGSVAGPVKNIMGNALGRITPTGRAIDDAEAALLPIYRAADGDPLINQAMADVRARWGNWGAGIGPDARDMVAAAKHYGEGPGNYLEYVDRFRGRVAYALGEQYAKAPRALPAPTGQSNFIVADAAPGADEAGRAYRAAEQFRAAHEVAPSTAMVRARDEADALARELASAPPGQLASALENVAQSTGRSVGDVIKSLADAGYDVRGLASATAYQGRQGGQYGPLDEGARQVLQSAREATGRVPFRPYRGQ